MKKFNKHIKNTFDQGKIPYNPDHWKAMENALSSGALADGFESKVKEILNSPNSTIPAPNWSAFEEKLKISEQPSSFENQISEKLNSEVKYNSSHWEQMNEKIHLDQLSGFEKAARNILSNSEAPYNPKHWDLLKAKLDGSKKPIWLFVSAVAACIALLIGSQLNLKEDAIIEPQNNVVDNEKINKSESIPFDNTASSNKSASSNANFDPNETGIQNKVNSINIAANNHSKNSSEVSIKKSDFTGIANKKQHNNINRNDTQKDNGISNSNGNNDKISVVSDHNPSNLPGYVQPHLPVQDKGLHGIVAIEQKCSDLPNFLESLYKVDNQFKVKKLALPLMHAGAATWLNFWDNPGITGFHGKHNFSATYNNNWLQEQDALGNKTTTLEQPLGTTIGYELNNVLPNISIGAYYDYQLKTNWNYNTANISIAYQKEIMKQLSLRIGVAADYRMEQLAVNRLTLREKISSEYITQSELGEFKSSVNDYIKYNAGAFLSHPYFFIGYSARDFKRTAIKESDAVQTTKHEIISGVHIPIYKRFVATAMLKANKEIETNYTPGLSIIYNDQIFLNSESYQLKDLKMSLGVMLHNRWRIIGAFKINNLFLSEEEQQILNTSTEKGNLSLSAYYTL